jgi:GntR family transcriptional regulator / MocR family aminotransferase
VLNSQSVLEPDEPGWLPFAPQPGETLRVALRRTLRDVIRSGALRPGVPLPASRALARQLGLSRGVVSDAYQQLESEGYLLTRPRAAPVVGAVVATPTPRPCTTAARRTAIYDMTPTTPDVTLFPLRRWLAAYDEVVRRSPAATLDYREPRGEEALREALADYLGRTRGVVADPERIVVVQGTAQAVDLLLRVLKARGRVRIAVEDPSHATQHERIRALQLELVAQPIDQEGVITEGLDSDGLLVTPAHQFPAGCVLSGPRRRQLLEWSTTQGALLVEDDYDAEFRYDREPVRALQGLGPDRVAYVGTVSKTLAPALRLGWVVAPDSLVDELVWMKRLADDFTPALDQLTLAALIRSGEYDRHLRSARVVYRRRRDRLATSLAKHFPRLTVEGIAAGVHLLVRLPPHVDDAAIVAEVRHAKIAVQALSYYQIRARGSGLVLGYGRLHESAIDAALGALAAIVDRHL